MENMSNQKPNEKLSEKIERAEEEYSQLKQKLVDMKVGQNIECKNDKKGEKSIFDSESDDDTFSNTQNFQRAFKEENHELAEEKSDFDEKLVQVDEIVQEEQLFLFDEEESWTREEQKLDQGALGMSDPCGPLLLALKPKLVFSINRLFWSFLLL